MARKKSSNPRYAGERITTLLPYEGVTVRFVEWYNPAVGQKKAVACAFQVFIGEEWVTLCRYDSEHRVFHRHVAAWREPGERDLDFPDVPMGERGATALEDVKNNIAKWIKLIPKEVIENEAAS